MAQVLIVEPDTKLAASYAAALQLRGHTVAVCTAAQAAVAQADRCRPDLVVLELQLVAHGGIEFLYEFRSYADWQPVPVIIVSHVPPGELAGSHDLLHRRLGVAAYHYKPQLTLRALQASVDTVLG